MSSQAQIPSTPRVLSPSPTPSESSDAATAGYFGPVTRSAAKRSTTASAITEEPAEADADEELEARARARSRSPHSTALRRRRASGHALPKAKPSAVHRSEPLVGPGAPAAANGFLSPASAAGFRSPASYWRELSRSPSPLGLIPIHRHWRRFVHRHEVPRKLLHVSIGFATLGLYARGLRAVDIHPWLLGALVPIAATDVLRHRVPEVNRYYVRALGALMRESEYDRYNGVIFYLGGAWFALAIFPKDVAVVSILLLSWCDTAASTFGRLYGRYTPRVRRGKSLAGSVAAAAIGAATAALFWGYVAPSYWGLEAGFMFQGTLGLPEVAEKTLVLAGRDRGKVGGRLALGLLSVCTGLVASASELVDVWDIDDNLTIPVLSAIGLWAFLKVFG